MRIKTSGLALAVVLAATAPSISQAAVFNIALTGTAGGFSHSQTDFSGLHFEQFSQALDSPDFGFTVSQGDTVNTTVTFDGLVTIPASMVRTDLVQYLSGSSFPGVNTQVTGTYNFFNGASLVETFSFTSSTFGGLASFSAVFPPGNHAFTFDSFTDNFDVTTLSAPGTIDRSSFTYSLVSALPGIPEPATWALMISGFGLAGMALRRRRVIA